MVLDRQEIMPMVLRLPMGLLIQLGGRIFKRGKKYTIGFLG